MTVGDIGRGDDNRRSYGGRWQQEPLKRETSQSDTVEAVGLRGRYETAGEEDRNQ